MVPEKPDAAIPMSGPDIGPEEVAAVLEVLRSGSLSGGDYRERFERQFAAFLGIRHAVAVSSGTAALHLCLSAVGVGPGDAVLTSPFTFVASANAILYRGARPIFVDVDPQTGNLDPARLAESLQAGASRGDPTRLRAILPIHVFGTPARMGPILELARRHGLAVVEDGCEALGAELDGVKTGAFGAAAAFGFYPNKQITTGEGGMAVTDSDDLAALLRSLRNQGRADSRDEFRHLRLGYNYRLDEMSCALGFVQMKRIGELLRKRETVAGWYSRRLAGLPAVETPAAPAPGVSASWFVYVVRIHPPSLRDPVRERLRALGVPSRPYFQPLHLQPVYLETLGHRRGDFPVAERLGDQSLALPFSGVMTEDQVDRVCLALRKAVSG